MSQESTQVLLSEYLATPINVDIVQGVADQELAKDLAKLSVELLLGNRRFLSNRQMKYKEVASLLDTEPKFLESFNQRVTKLGIIRPGIKVDNLTTQLFSREQLFAYRALIRANSESGVFTRSNLSHASLEDWQNIVNATRLAIGPEHALLKYINDPSQNYNSRVNRLATTNGQTDIHPIPNRLRVTQPNRAEPLETQIRKTEKLKDWDLAMFSERLGQISAQIQTDTVSAALVPEELEVLLRAGIKIIEAQTKQNFLKDSEDPTYYQATVVMRLMRGDIDKKNQHSQRIVTLYDYFNLYIQPQLNRKSPS